MSLEAAIAELTKAVTLNNELLTQAATERAALLSQSGATTKPADDKPKADPKPKADDKPKADKPKADPKPKVEEISDDKIKEVAGAYLGVEDLDEREVRKANVRALLDELGSKKATELPQDKRPAFLAKIAELSASTPAEDDMV